MTKGKSVPRPKDQFDGDRSGTLTDPWGHLWHVATHKEDIPHEELAKRAEAAMQQDGGAPIEPLSFTRIPIFPFKE